MSSCNAKQDKKTNQVWRNTRRQTRYETIKEEIPGMGKEKKTRRGVRHHKKTNQVWGITRKQTRYETLQEDKPGMGHYKKTDEM
jgi:hypothetical protein